MNKLAKIPSVQDAMDEIDATNTLAGAMALAFAEIDAATKSANNPHFKSKYADLGAVIDAVKPALIKHRLFFTQRSHPDERGVCVETVLHHAGGDEMSLGKLFVPANKQDPQGFGSALTYARRYGLLTAFGVPTEDDDGNAASRSAQSRPTTGETPPVKSAHKDDPFPQGPARNRSDLKVKGRAFWRDVEAAGDTDELEILLADKDNQKLVHQIMVDLPQWWDGGKDKEGNSFEGLEDVIARKRRDFEQLENALGPAPDGSTNGEYEKHER